MTRSSTTPRPISSRPAGNTVQRKCDCGGTCASCQGDTRVQAQALPGRTPSDIDSSLPSSSPGVPMASSVRERIEPVLGADLGHVRVHEDSESRGTARELGARAFTHGSHIFLGPDQHADDVALLAHEATHVVQQTGSESGAHPDVQLLAEGNTTQDGEAPRQRILGRIRTELGDDASTSLDAVSRRAPEQSATPSGASSTATPSTSSSTIDRSELATRRGELEPAARPDVDRAAEVSPQVSQAAQQTTVEAETPGAPVAATEAPANAPKGKGKSPVLAAAEAASAQADAAFSAAESQPQPSGLASVVPPKPVAPVDARGAPVAMDPSADGALVGVAEQAQSLRDEGLNLRQHAAEERANAETLRGNLQLVEQGVSQAEQGVATSQGHLSYRREVTETARQSLDVSREKARTVAEQAPGFASQAEEGHAQSGPMASEASGLASESSSAASDDAEAAEAAQEQSGKLNKVNSDLTSTDSAITQTQARAGTLQQEAAQATQLNTATDARLTATETTLGATEARLGQMQEQNATARGRAEALSGQPDSLLRQAGDLDAQGQQMLDASEALEARVLGAQQTHSSALGALPEVRAAEPEAPAPETAGGMPEDYRYEDRASVDLASRLPSWFSGADPVSAEQRAKAEQDEQERRRREVREIEEMAGGDVASIGPGQRAWIALRMTGRHLFSSVKGIRWPGWGHLALGLIDPRGPLMGVVGGMSMMLSGGANLLSLQQWKRDPLGNLLKSAADIATGLTIILGSITALAGVIIAIMGALTLLSLGTLAPVTGPVIAFCASVMATVGGWTLTVGEIALLLQGLVLIKNLIDAAAAQTAQQLQNQSDKLTADVSSAGNVVMQMGMAKLAQVGGRAMQAEISAAGGGVGFARTVGGVRTTGAGSYARAVGGVVRGAPSKIASGARMLASRQGRSEIWQGVRGMFKGDGQTPMSAREGFSRDFLVGPRSTAGEAGAAVPHGVPPVDPVRPIAEAPPQAPPAPEAPPAARQATAPHETAPAPEVAPAPHETAPVSETAPAPHETAPTPEPTPHETAPVSETAPTPEPATPAPHETAPTPEPTPAPRETAPAPETAPHEPAPQPHEQVPPREQAPANEQAPVARDEVQARRQAREEAVAESGRHEHINGEQVQTELEHIGENPRLIEGTPPNRRARVGEHEWREGPDGRWCRYSLTPTVCSTSGPPGVSPAPPRSVDDVRGEMKPLREAERNGTLTDAQRERLNQLDQELNRHYQTVPGETPAQTERRLFDQRPGETLEQYRARMAELEDEVLDAATRSGGAPALAERYQQLLKQADEDLATLTQKRAELAEARAQWKAADERWVKNRAASRRGQMVPDDQHVSTRQVDALAERMRQLERDVRGLESRGSARSERYQFGDVGKVEPCFSPDTPVHTPGGARAIGSLEVGDEVLAWDPEARSVVPRAVREVYRNATEVFIHVSVAGGLIRATREHPFWLEEERVWRAASLVRPGDVLRGLHGPVVVGSVAAVAVVSPTVNLEVEGLHNYFVGAHGVLVHNGRTKMPGFDDPTRRSTRIYLVQEKMPDGSWRDIYVGKTYQGSAGDVTTRFDRHLATKQRWADLAALGEQRGEELIRVRMLREGQWNTFETAVWEEHFIQQHGGRAALENTGVPITQDTFNEYKKQGLFQGC
ncbi:DUF4157 domain-containing protein [Myxococcus sp. K15C18031901]|uniref:eCIS core domain-containing protein n=1 Tax=Myxococcus dinghuensis TaxID=2906761 RepID=UPI0020A73DE1|nr:DUF4157 domain-containing protein [Myxococcus dinghuensis]MCP3097289.1 DUF4157 domain-containing protein [Myxococcus dinghuensis]